MMMTKNCLKNLHLLLDTEATVSPCLQYTWNLIKDTSALVYCLTVFDECHMFVL